MKDPTRELAFMREKIMMHVDRLQCSDISQQRLMGDWIEIYIKELEKQLRELEEKSGHESITKKEEPMEFTVYPHRIIADYYVGKRPGYLALQCCCKVNLYFPKQAEHGKYLLTCPKCGQPWTYHN